MAALVCELLVTIRTQTTAAQNSVIAVQVDKPGAAIPASLFGIFFEDINFAADGGIYPERVKNHSFEFPEPMMGWKKIERSGSKATIALLEQDPLNPNVHRYDNYPRTGPKVFAGEFAAHIADKTRPDKPNNWEAALAEAAFMTGLERKSASM